MTNELTKMATDNNNVPIEVKQTHVPSLDELVTVLETGLRTNFSEVSVSVVDCPDLTQAPWHLAAPGLGGSPCILDIGGVPYLMPVPDRSKLYDFGEISSLAGLKDPFIIGAGAASSRVVGVNAEMMPNVKLSKNNGDTICTHTAKVSTQDGSCILEKYSSLETGPLVNVLACNGKPGKVLEIKAKCRIGEDDFVHCLRKAVSARYGEVAVAMGGVFLLKKGKAKFHIMPDFACVPLDTRDKINDWLQFYTMSAPMICLSEFVSHDPDLDLRVEHTHCFSNHGDGGHYHHDVTPDEVEYHGFYTVAEKIVRVDRPTETHELGRD